MRVVTLLKLPVVFASALFCLASVAAEPSAPARTATHTGAATCAGSSCHGASRPVADSSVRQDEYVLWQNHDKHARAFKALLSPAGKRIAANLGLKDASAAPECLTCHTDYVAADQRGQKFDVTTGVSCEACHGGARNWLGPHVSGNTHAENVAAGLYPLEQPQARAKLCLGCHLGNTEKPVDHRLMGAGHPPLEFELDNYSNTQSDPPHFVVDKDYRQRKTYTSDARIWAIGQLSASDFFLDGLLGSRFVDRGMFPELVFFECGACHHPTDKLRWNPGAAGPLGVGQPRLADANLVMSGVMLGVLAPDVAKDWKSALAQLHAASQESVPKVRDAAKRLRDVSTAATRSLAAREISKPEALSLIKSLSDLGASQRYGDYAASRQIYFGVDALLTTLKKDQGVPGAVLNAEITQVFKALNTPASYDALAVKDAMQQLHAAAEKVQQ